MKNISTYRNWLFAFLFAITMIMPQSVWADGGVWTYKGTKYGICAVTNNTSIRYVGLTSTSGWGDYSILYREDLGWGSKGTEFGGKTTKENEKFIAICYFSQNNTVPAYAKLVRTSTFSLAMASNRYQHGAGLYMFDTEYDATNTFLDAMPYQTESNAAPSNCIIKISEKTASTKYDASSKEIIYDNSNSANPTTFTKYISLAHVTCSYGSTNVAGTEWAGFLEAFTDTWTYYATITFNANGGSGTMENQTIENSGKLNTNKFTCQGKDFVGWNTKADGTGTAYGFNAGFTASDTLKGPITLYAQWGDLDILTFTAEEDNAEVSLYQNGTPESISLLYSTDGTTWHNYTISTQITLQNKGDQVRFKAGTEENIESGVNEKFSDSLVDGYSFRTKKKVSASGNVMSLLDATCQSDSLKNGCFSGLFMGNEDLTHAPKLPATILAEYCYKMMFNGCRSLIQSPSLPAETLALGCYASMFSGCSSLTQASPISATTFAEDCCYYMFDNCSSLTQAPLICATTLARSCCRAMFEGCRSLTQAPSLPVTTLQWNCYKEMFKGCTSLTQAPSLPATTLASSCYQSMFEGCTSLTQAPSLPAVTLASSCYWSMFSGCTSLTQAPSLPAETLSSKCYAYMFENCSNLKYIKVAFLNFPEDDYNSGTRCWLSNVVTSGIFECPDGLDCSTRGESYVPTSWTIKKPDILKFTADEAGSTIALNKNQYPEEISLIYSTDGNTWHNYTIGQQIALTNAGDHVRFKAGTEEEVNFGRNNNFSKHWSSSYRFAMSGKISASGNVMSLLDATCQSDTIPVESCFASLFTGCSSLTQAPSLPATTLANNCYEFMFYGCTSLKQSPVLPASTFADECYKNMFEDCSSLTCIKTTFTSWPSNRDVKDWLSGAGSTGAIYTDHCLPTSGVPANWKVLQHDDYLVSVDSKSATCTTAGNKSHLHCEKCEKNFLYRTDVDEYDPVIPALGHDYGNGTWSWMNDGHSATWNGTCSRSCTDGHTASSDVTLGNGITSAELVAPTCKDMGTTRYSASTTVIGVAHADTKDVVDIAATGVHSFTDYVYNNDVTCAAQGTKTANCAYNCGATDTQTDEEHALLPHTLVHFICKDCQAQPAQVAAGTLEWGKDYKRTSDCAVADLTFTRDFADADWQTWYEPFELTLTSANSEGYEFARINNVHQYEDENGNIDQTVVECFRITGKLHANYPYIVKKVDGSGTMMINTQNAALQSATESSIVCESMDYTYTFTGNYQDKSISSIFALDGGDWTAATQASAQTHYLTITPRADGYSSHQAAPARVLLQIIGEEDATGIVTLYTETKRQAETYTLSGQRLAPGAKGLQIRNGKTMFVK